MKLAIKGHPERDKEIIKILKSLGGKLPSCCNLTFKYDQIGYFIKQNGFIAYSHIDNLDDSNYVIYTLERFETLYPYKVGEKVLYLNGNSKWCEGIVDKMYWDENNETLYYDVNNIDGTNAGKATIMFLKPMKQKELKDYLKPGYVVEYDDGVRFILTQDVHGNVFGVEIHHDQYWTILKDLSLIVAVYQITSPSNLHYKALFDSSTKKVWERKEIELTMQQIADKFGIDVNQLKIKK